MLLTRNWVMWMENVRCSVYQGPYDQGLMMITMININFNLHTKRDVIAPWASAWWFLSSHFILKYFVQDYLDYLLFNMSPYGFSISRGILAVLQMNWLILSIDGTILLLVCHVMPVHTYKSFQYLFPVILLSYCPTW